jgi:hypothetical protein
MDVLNLVGTTKSNQVKILDRHPRYFMYDSENVELGRAFVIYHRIVPQFAIGMSAKQQTILSKSAEVHICKFEDFVSEEEKAEATRELLVKLLYKAECKHLKSIWSIMPTPDNEFIKYEEDLFESWNDGLHFVRVLNKKEDPVEAFWRTTGNNII